MSEPRLESSGAAIGRIPSGLFILTTISASGAPAGMLVSWAQQASFSPPLVSVALGRDRGLREPLERAGLFALSILGREDRALAGLFSRPPEPGTEGRGPFDRVPTETRPSGLVVLKGALAFVECRLFQKVPAGDHVLYFGEVLDGAPLRDGEPAVHWRKSGLQY